MARFPDRPPNATSGSRFAQKLSSMLSGGRTDQMITDEILKGNFPEFLRNLVPITISDKGNTLVYKVMPDVLAVGSNEDFKRFPISAPNAQRIADVFACMLPTPTISDQIWQHADVKLKPQPLPADKDMTDINTFNHHDDLIQQQLGDNHLGELVAGQTKDVVISNQLAGHPDRLGIHGWHDENGKPIQGGALSKHDVNYVDYSHGIRLVDQNAILNGKEVNLLRDVLQNREYASMVNGREGPLLITGYQYGKSQEIAPLPKTNDNLQKLNEYLEQLSKMV
jgi:hypothetical protein